MSAPYPNAAPQQVDIIVPEGKSGAPMPQPDPGYPPQQPGYPPQQPGYPPQQQPGYPQQQPGYPSQQPGQPPQQQQPGYPAQPGGQAIGMQPVPGVPPVGGPGGWAQGQAPVNCPPGLEYLVGIDQLLVKQKKEVFEAVTGCERNNKYEVCNTLGQTVYRAKEDNCCCVLCCCGAVRPFDMKIKDNQNREVMHLSRPLRCNTCWCPCCLQVIEVQAPPGTVIGYVKQGWHLCKPKFYIQNVDEETILGIKGPCCQWNICGDVEFDVTSADHSTEVGRISKQWSGLAKEVFTDADNFGISFPMDLDVKMKAVMLGAIFLIDFMYFENDKKNVKKEMDHLH
ncbi:phospholipid scramblase 2-like [Haliotis cracherodii]|uniref:phospholipid scramblase 2-like n=1 Tax=Haliotis cracherodii TaxID=6455 RepID=UPI0039EAB6F3